MESNEKQWLGQMCPRKSGRFCSESPLRFTNATVGSGMTGKTLATW
jgi:hypothetical protein